MVAQGRDLSQPRDLFVKLLNPEIVEVESYTFPGDEYFTVLRMDYARYRIHNPGAWEKVRKGVKVTDVDVVFTRYPDDLDSWEVGYDSLLQHRFESLKRLDPSIFDDPASVTWRLVLQTDCHSIKQAKGLFHGLVVKYRPLESKASPDRTVAFLDQLLSEEIPIIDSTAIKVMSRHPEWKNMLVVMDWTGSMYVHGAQAVIWQQLNAKKNAIRHFVFFNDGDSTANDSKLVGDTRGIYATESSGLEEVKATMADVTLGGNGGDMEENDLEAVIQGMDQFDDYESIILIADNKSPVRDLELLPTIHKPIHIIVCGSHDGSIHPHYLTIANYTGGSVHTIEQDLYNLAKDVKRGILEIGEHRYEYRREQFRRVF